MRIFVLGAADPEMGRIEAVLRNFRETVLYAAVNGTRVYPGNAYQADGVIDAAGAVVETPSAAETVTVECALTGLVPAKAVDHHRPGDAGYGLSPARFWEGSSLGQIFAVLGLEPTAEDLYAAAADHCLHAAYRGDCPEVNPEGLMVWRAESRAAFQGRSVASVLADVAKARKLLREWSQAGDIPHFATTVAELPEAAAREGLPFTAEMTDRNGRRKVVLQGADPMTIQAWMATGGDMGLVDVYGDLIRGFAGGYLPA
ncbi:hypothetical protein [Acidithiobacillus thiooxidans]|nr:hypothetical protein [Acidithiobacillus thiooxidans]